MGIYVGRSPSHASNVALILNPRTGHVSPQFHVVYDDDFTTVPYLRTTTVPPHWAELVRTSSTIALYTEHEVEFGNLFLSSMLNQEILHQILQILTQHL